MSVDSSEFLNNLNLQEEQIYSDVSPTTKPHSCGSRLCDAIKSVWNAVVKALGMIFCCCSEERSNKLADKVSLYIPPSTPWGLRNHGNTCFGNAVLKSVFLIKQAFKLDKAENPVQRIIERLQHEFCALSQPNERIVSKQLHKLWEVEDGNYKHFPLLRAFQQHDAHEFLTNLISALYPNGAPGLQISKLVTSNHMALSMNPSTDPVLELSADIQANKPAGANETPFQSLLTEYFEQNPSDAPLECVGYQASTERAIIRAERDAPQLLPVRLPRFIPNDQGVYRKDSTPVSGLTETFSLDFCRADGQIARQERYRPVTWVLHSGSISGGHYTALTKNSDGTYIYHDDDRTREMEEEEAERLIAKNSYMFLCEKQPPA